MDEIKKESGWFPSIMAALVVGLVVYLCFLAVMSAAAVLADLFDMEGLTK